MKMEQACKITIVRQDKERKPTKRTIKWENPKVMKEKTVSAGPTKKSCLGWKW